MKRSRASRNVVRFSEETYLEEPHGPPLLREHWVRDPDGTVLRYALTFIDFRIHPGDNGRVLGYDNAHRIHERHFMGAVELFPFTTYTELFGRFIDEVASLRRAHGQL